MKLLSQSFEVVSNEGYESGRSPQAIAQKKSKNQNFLNSSRDLKNKDNFEKFLNKATREKSIDKDSLKMQKMLKQSQAFEKKIEVKISQKEGSKSQDLSKSLSKISQLQFSSGNGKEAKRGIISSSEKPSHLLQNKKIKKEEEQKGEKEINSLSAHQFNNPLTSFHKERQIQGLTGFQDDKNFRLLNIKGKKIQVSVEDLRSEKGSLKKKGDFSHSLLKSLESFGEIRKLNTFDMKFSQNFSSDSFTGFLGDWSNGSTNFSSHTQKNPLGFSSSFLNEWESKIHSQIADKAHLILKDNNQGEIRLCLHPEHLGNVRVHLDLKDGQVLAKFIVENPQVKQLFESSSSLLQNSLEQSGMDVSLSFSHFKQNNEESHSRQDKRERFTQRNTISSLNIEQGSSVENIDIFLSKEVEDSINMIV